MTSRERYEAGLVMEQDGASGKEIAAAMGYKDELSWYQAKYRYKKKDTRTAKEEAKAEEAKQASADAHDRLTKGLIARALENNSPAPEPAPILDGLKLEKVPVPVKPVLSAKAQTLLDEYTKREKERDKKQLEASFISHPYIHMPEVPIKRLAIKTEINADGELLSYKAGGGKVSIRKRGSHKSSLVLTVSELRVVLAELTELMTEVPVC